jgi:hypothetical protein
MQFQGDDGNTNDDGIPGHDGRYERADVAHTIVSHDRRFDYGHGCTVHCNDGICRHTRHCGARAKDDKGYSGSMTMGVRTS